MLSALPGLQLLDHHEVREAGQAAGCGSRNPAAVGGVEVALLPTHHSALRLSEHWEGCGYG